MFKLFMTSSATFRPFWYTLSTRKASTFRSLWLAVPRIKASIVSKVRKGMPAHRLPFLAIDADDGRYRLQKGLFLALEVSKLAVPIGMGGSGQPLDIHLQGSSPTHVANARWWCD
jgi:hypothetical protein